MNIAARSVQGTAARPPSTSAAPWRSVSTRSRLRCRYQLAARQDLDTDHGRHYVPASEPCSLLPNDDPFTASNRQLAHRSIGSRRTVFAGGGRNVWLWAD